MSGSGQAAATVVQTAPQGRYKVTNRITENISHADERDDEPA